MWWKKRRESKKKKKVIDVREEGCKKTQINYLVNIQKRNPRLYVFVFGTYICCKGEF